MQGSELDALLVPPTEVLGVLVYIPQGEPVAFFDNELEAAIYGHWFESELLKLRDRLFPTEPYSYCDWAVVYHRIVLWEWDMR